MLGYTRPVRRAHPGTLLQEAALVPSYPSPPAAVQPFGPLQPLLDDPTVTEIMVVTCDRVYVERDGVLEATDVRFPDSQAVVDVAQRIIAPLGRELSLACPVVDGRLDQPCLRVTATVPPFSRTPTLTLRKHTLLTPTREDYLRRASASAEILDFLLQAVAARANLLIAGPAGSGKTTLVRLLARAIPSTERIITVEETLELGLSALHPHVVELETRPSTRSSVVSIDAEEAMRQVLHMRPDRIVLGEIRGREALQLLVAMGTGHRGSLGTLHANGLEDVFDRLLFAMQQGKPGLGPADLLRYAATTLDLIVYVERSPSGHRRVAAVAEVEGVSQGSVTLRPLFRYQGGEFVRGQSPSPRLQGVLAQP